MADVEGAKAKSGFRIPIVSEVSDALKNTADLKGAAQTAVGGAEVAALLYALSLSSAEERAALGGVILGSSLFILGLIREKSRK